MKLYVGIFVLLSVMFFSCKKEYTQREKDRIEALTANHVYKYKVPEDAFVFCLDTIKTREEFDKLDDEYCKKGKGLNTYMYLSTYGVYLPFIFESFCGDIFCYKKRDVMRMSVNKDFKWLVNDELYEELSQVEMDKVLKNYYEFMESNMRNKSSLIIFNASHIKNNYQRDSVFISIVHSYYSFIKEKKRVSNKSIDRLRVEYPINLQVVDNYHYSILPPPPPPLSKEKIIID
ncbi:hypothetical protein [Pseudofulvibacter geojedonensis]|uniref:Lipoprotein n=1 Tax=Pseudofulvibacter geojedonensis TaxID=1123758 RepID=A0ABW3I160_9FLAO